MATLAETVTDVTDDRLAARNALVLAAAQALAGGNNTVIVATGGIVGTMLAPDPALATVPISFMAVGMWIGTLPVGILAKAPSDAASRCRPVRYSACYPASSPAPPYCRAHSGFSLSARFAPVSTPRRINPIALRQPIPRAHISARGR
jgi:hypothetical protein